MENSNTASIKKTIEVEVVCERLQTKNVYSDYDVNYYNDENNKDTYYKELGYSTPEEALECEENKFGFESKYELNVKIDGKYADTIGCIIKAQFDAKDNDYWLSTQHTYIEFCGNAIIGFTGEEIAKLIYDAIDKDDELWSSLKKQFGYNGIEDSHELVYGRPFEEELQEEIAKEYENFIF